MDGKKYWDRVGLSSRLRFYGVAPERSNLSGNTAFFNHFLPSIFCHSLQNRDLFFYRPLAAYQPSPRQTVVELIFRLAIATRLSHRQADAFHQVALARAPVTSFPRNF